MKPIPHQIEGLIKDALTAAQTAGTLPAFDVPASVLVTRPKNLEQGDYATAIAMSLAKPFGRKPLEIAQAIEHHFPASDLLSTVEAVAPGFVNMRLSQAWVRSQIEKIITEQEQFFRLDSGKGRKAQVEFVSANPTGPLHIGRTRGAILGDTLATILTEIGWKVDREYYFNNAGAQMEKLGLSLRARYLQALGRDAELPEKGYEGDYLITFAQEIKEKHGDSWQNNDWQPFKEYAEEKIFKIIENTLARVNIRFDNFFNENSLYTSNAVWDVLERLKSAGYIYESVHRENATAEEMAKVEFDKPALWFRSTTLGDHQDRTVVKSSGEPTYVLPDIAYHINKLERGYDRVVDIFGTDHIDEAKTVSYGLKALDYDTSKVDVILHQFVTFGKDKMSTRAGNYVTLDDLIDAVGADVVRYFMLARSANSHLDFDFDLAKQQSNDNPVYYIQNAHVRCCGIFRQVEERGLPLNWDKDADLSLLGEREIVFVQKALEYPEQLQLAADHLAPHQIAFWALDLAREFHPLYDEVRVLHSDVPEDVARARLRFYRMAQVVFQRVLKLMGMSAPERM